MPHARTNPLQTDKTDSVDVNALTDEIIEDVIDVIEATSSEQLAGLLSGTRCLYLNQDYEIWILPVGAESDGAYRQACGRIYDLAVNWIDSHGDDHEFLAAAVGIVGMPEGCEELDDLEEDGIADEIRAAAMDTSPEFMQRCRDTLKLQITPAHIRQMIEELLDHEREARDAA